MKEPFDYVLDEIQSDMVAFGVSYVRFSRDGAERIPLEKIRILNEDTDEEE